MLRCMAFMLSSERQLERVARYIARPALAIDSLGRREDGSLEIQTPPDPRTGATLRILDTLEWIHTVAAHIPDRGQHQVRYYGAFSNRARSAVGLGKAKSHRDPQAEQPSDEDSDFTKARRASWARLLRKIFEVDPLLCACGAAMKIVSIITEAGRGSDPPASRNPCLQSCRSVSAAAPSQCDSLTYVRKRTRLSPTVWPLAPATPLRRRIIPACPESCISRPPPASQRP